jgi:membrane protein
MKVKWLELSQWTFKEFREDNVLRLGAALAYYSVFSLGPLLVIVVGIAGLVFGKDTIRRHLSEQIASLVGSGSAQIIESMMAARSKDAGLMATVLGIALLLLGASGVFGQLQDALNTIWEVKAKPGQGLWGFVRNRFLSMAMVLGTGFLLLISLVLTTALTALSGYAAGIMSISEVLMHILNFALSFVVVTVLFAMIFKFLPDVRIMWRDVWVGSVGTALLFTGGKYVLGLYLGRESVASAYGAAGSVVLILLWVYYSSLILFFGAEFTQVYAKRAGARIVPTKNAVPIREGEREEQGIPHEQPAPAALSIQADYSRGMMASSNRPSNVAADHRELARPIERRHWHLASIVIFAFLLPLLLKKNRGARLWQ